ncbi:MAG: hypothetical protein HQL19_02100 [Candidatus Omnitrophica bacterium]|nr:hypothetical protein [Candidatus Omnitrophota bacterium]
MVRPRVFQMLLILFTSFFLIRNQAFAENKTGEIINVNAKYRLAFADLTEKDVQPGDKVAVRMDNGKSIYLVVLETYPVMVKLSSSDVEGEALSEEEFSKITVGKQVTPAGVQTAIPAQKTSVQPMPKEEKSKPLVKSAPVAVMRSDTETPTAIEVFQPKGSAAVAPPVPMVNTAADLQPKVAALEARLDQMINNNIKLSETVTQLFSEKTHFENVIKAKDAEIAETKRRVGELEAVNLALEGRVKSVQDQMALADKTKADDQKEIEALNQKMNELKKKLARMVEIVNNHMRSYE